MIGPVIFLSFAVFLLVGTPIAITGTPSVFWDNSFLLFPTPAPGLIPVSQS